MPTQPPITITALVRAPIDVVWKSWTTPESIMEWNSPSPEWHTPRATLDLREGGAFNSRMEAKDGSAGFDFAGTFTKVIPNKQIDYKIGDGRTVSVTFEERNDNVVVTETFEPETLNPIEMQRAGWQAILDNFKNYAESR